MKKIKYTLANGKTCFALKDSDIGLINEYQEYLENIAGECSTKTLEAKAQDLKVFFEYCMVFNDLTRIRQFGLGKSNNLRVTRTLLGQIVLAFPEYLAFGIKSESEISIFAANILKPKPKSESTVRRILSSVSSFFKSSAITNKELLNLNTADFIDIDVDNETLFEELSKRKKLKYHEVESLKKRSMLANVIRGGARYCNSTLFSYDGSTLSQSQSSSYFLEKSFPIPFIKPLLNSAKTYRELCLWALCAGTGIRISEATQLLIRDIDVKNQIIYTIDYKKRMALYSSIPKEWRDKLTWKGREMEQVFFIKYFKDIFFQNLQNYLLYERRPCSCNHEFLFVVLDNANKGKPLFTSHPDTINNPLRKAQDSIGLYSSYTIHSLRHFFGFFLKNFYYVGNGKYGFSISTVQSLMGHSLEKSTEIYAIEDKTVQLAQANIANALFDSVDFDPAKLVEQAINCKVNQTMEKALDIR